MQKKLKIAIVMGGGWSLGAFTGGAAWELVRQLHGNRDRDRFDRCEIDVLCGAGGGALAAAVLLRTLANPDGFGPTAAVARLGEAQRAAWIEGVDFTRLMRDVAMSKPSLLDRGAIDELVLDLLAWPAGEPARPVLLGRRVLLGMALLNFNGVPIRASNTSALPDAVSTTRFRDHRTFCFDLGRPALRPRNDWRHFDGDRVSEADTWREVAATAVASGAFPIAFEPVVLERYREEYGPLWPEELEGRAEFPFTYGDAGAFNPQPLREAMELVSAQDAQEPPDSFTRVLIFIDPNLSGSKHAFGLRFHLPYLVDVGNRPFARHDVVPADPAAHLVAITNRFGVLARHQGMFEDLIAAEHINARHAWRSELRTLIAELVDRLEGDASQLVARVEDRLARVLERSRALSTSGGSDADDAIARIALEQTGKDKRSAELPSRDRLAFALMALMDEVAGLSGKQRVHVIIAGPTAYHPPDGSPPITVKLTGDFFANFGGYFDPRYRVHDFDAGRALVSSALAAAVPPLLAEPSDRPAYKPWSDPPPSLDTAPAARDRFVRRIAELTRQLLAYKIGYMGVTQAITIVAQYVAPKLVRDSGPARRPAIVRVEVAPGTDDAEFYLAGSARGEHGGNAHRLADVVVLHTVLHYSDTEIVGPHVFASPDGAKLRLVAQRKRKRERNAFLDLTLPPPIVFQTNADAGLPIHAIRVDWPNRSASAWAEEDALRQWPGVPPS